MNKKLIFIFLFAFLMIGMVSASFLPIKNYNEETQTVVISNFLGLGKDYISATLIWGDTKVGIGIDTHVGTFNYTPLDENSYISDLDLINLRNNNIMTRGKQYKVLTYVEQDKFISQCEDIWSEINQTLEQKCELVEDGTYLKEEWKPLNQWLNTNNFIVGETQTIGVFVDTEQGDYGDWIPTLMGFEIDEWATWTASLEVDLISYYKLDESSGSVIDSLGTNNGTNNGATPDITGKINKSYSFDGTNDYVDLNTEMINENESWSVNLWAKPTIIGDYGFMVSQSSGSAGQQRVGVRMQIDGTVLAMTHEQGGTEQLAFSTTALDISAFKMVTATRNSTNICIYIDSVLEDCDDFSGYDFGSSTNEMWFGVRASPSSNVFYFNGILDEVGIWNRALTPTEITQLYNSGTGITYYESTDSSPELTLISPANDTTFNYPSIEFKANVSDDLNLINVSLLIDGTIDQTNTSGTNGTTYTFSKSLTTGEHNWSIIAYDNASQLTESETRVLNITIIPPTIELSIPKDNLITNIASHTFYAYVTDNLKVDNVSFYYDGSLDQTNTDGTNATNYSFSKTLTEGSHTWYIEAWDNDSFDSTSATRTITLDTTPFIEFLTPPTLVNVSNITQEYIPMKVNVSTPYFENISFDLYNINGTLFNKFYITEVYDINFTDIPDAHYHYNVTICTTTSQCNTTETRHLNHDATSPIINVTSPIETIGIVYEFLNITLNTTATDVRLDTVYYTYGNFTSDLSYSNKTFYTSMDILVYNWTDASHGTTYRELNIPTLCKVEGIANITSFATSSFPGLFINYTCTNTTGTYPIGRISRPTLLDTPFTLIQTGKSIIPSTNGTLSTSYFSYEVGEDIINVYANDTFGNLAKEEITIDYNLREDSIIYNANTIEGNLENYQLNLIKKPTVSITKVELKYNGLSDVSSIFLSDDNVTAISEIVVPSVSADTIKTFYFEITFSDLTTANTTFRNQTVQNIIIDDCSVETKKFLTLFLKDEELQTELNGTIEISYKLLNPINFGEVLNFSEKYENVTEKSFCSNLNLNESTFFLDAEIKYGSTNYSSEFYNLQRSDLSSYPLNISLYDLNLDDTTLFKITYQGSDLIGAEGAIVQLQRKYINEGVYKLVEAPLTSSESTAILHIDTNTNLYRAIVVKDGEVLGTYDNLAFICQSELTGECTLDLFDVINPDNFVNIDTLRDFSYTITSEDQTIDIGFTIPSGTPSEVQVVLVQTDIIGDSTVCNTTLVSSAGLITCTFSESIEDSILDLRIYKNEELLSQKGYAVQDDLTDDWNGNNYFIVIILTLSLVFMALTSPEFIIINAVISLLFAGGVWLLNGLNFTVGIGVLIWLVIAAIILIMKISKQEDL